MHMALDLNTFRKTKNISIKSLITFPTQYLLRMIKVCLFSSIMLLKPCWDCLEVK